MDENGKVPVHWWAGCILGGLGSLCAGGVLLLAKADPRIPFQAGIANAFFSAGIAMIASGVSAPFSRRLSVLCGLIFWASIGTIILFMVMPTLCD